MAIEVEVIGNGHYAGAKSNIGTYTVTEDSTPVEISDRTGGTGQVVFTAVDDPSRLGSVLLLGDTLRLTDGDRGIIEGRINEIRGNNGILNITADSLLGRLVVDKQALGVDGTFEDAVTYYLGLAGITSGIAIDTSLASIPIVAPGFRGDLWRKISDLCTTVGAEITLLKDVVTFRPVRERFALEVNNVDESWSVANNDLAKEIEVYYYNTERRVNELVYPAGGWTDDITVYTVDAGQLMTVNIPVDVTIESIQQPTVQDTVTQTHDSSSVYAVCGKDGEPISAATWLSGGGDLTVAIGEDQKSIDVTIRGSQMTDNSPYRIAVSQGPSDYYSSLRVVGTGVHYRRESVILPTGADDASTSRDVGVTVDNIYITTREQAIELGTDAAGRWSSPQRTLNISKAYINKPGETDPQFDYATFADFDAYAAAESLGTFGDFDTEWSGQTFEQFDEYWYSLVENDFEFQVFGNAAGARIRWRRSLYRIRSATITESSVQYTAEADTTFADFDASADWGDPGMTFGDFDTLYAGLTFSDFALIPLPHVLPEYER